MINLARQAFGNPFLSAVSSSFQPGAVGSVGRCPVCGNAVTVGSPLQNQTAGFNPVGVGATFGPQLDGSVPTPYAGSQETGFGQINPLAAQFATGVTGLNPMIPQQPNWPVSPLLSHQGVGGRTGAYGGAYGIDPRYALGAAAQQFGYNDPNVLPGLNPAIAGDPIASLLSQQWNQQPQQQLPIRSLIGGQQVPGPQSFVQGFVPTNQWTDPYRAFIEAQLISQLTNNPLYQLQRAYGGVPEATVPGMPFGAGQQFNPLFSNVPFYG